MCCGFYIPFWVLVFSLSELSVVYGARERIFDAFEKGDWEVTVNSSAPITNQFPRGYDVEERVLFKPFFGDIAVLWGGKVSPNGTLSYLSTDLWYYSYSRRKWEHIIGPLRRYDISDGKYPNGRKAFGFAVDERNKCLYIIGGRTIYGYVDDVWVFCDDSRKWTLLYGALNETVLYNPLVWSFYIEFEWEHFEIVLYSGTDGNRTDIPPLHRNWDLHTLKTSKEGKVVKFVEFKTIGGNFRSLQKYETFDGSSTSISFRFQTKFYFLDFNTGITSNIDGWFLSNFPRSVNDKSLARLIPVVSHPVSNELKSIMYPNFIGYYFPYQFKPTFLFWRGFGRVRYISDIDKGPFIERVEYVGGIDAHPCGVALRIEGSYLKGTVFEVDMASFSSPSNTTAASTIRQLKFRSERENLFANVLFHLFLGSWVGNIFVIPMCVIYAVFVFLLCAVCCYCCCPCFQIAGCIPCCVCLFGGCSSIFCNPFLKSCGESTRGFVTTTCFKIMMIGCGLVDQKYYRVKKAGEHVEIYRMAIEDGKKVYCKRMKAGLNKLENDMNESEDMEEEEEEDSESESEDMEEEGEEDENEISGFNESSEELEEGGEKDQDRQSLQSMGVGNEIHVQRKNEYQKEPLLDENNGNAWNGKMMEKLEDLKNEASVAARRRLWRVQAGQQFFLFRCLRRTKENPLYCIKCCCTVWFPDPFDTMCIHPGYSISPGCFVVSIRYLLNVLTFFTTFVALSFLVLYRVIELAFPELSDRFPVFDYGQSTTFEACFTVTMYCYLIIDIASLILEGIFSAIPIIEMFLCPAKEHVVSGYLWISVTFEMMVTVIVTELVFVFLQAGVPVFWAGIIPVLFKMLMLCFSCDNYIGEFLNEQFTDDVLCCFWDVFFLFRFPCLLVNQCVVCVRDCFLCALTRQCFDVCGTFWVILLDVAIWAVVIVYTTEGVKKYEWGLHEEVSRSKLENYWEAIFWMILFGGVIDAFLVISDNCKSEAGGAGLLGCVNVPKRLKNSKWGRRRKDVEEDGEDEEMKSFESKDMKDHIVKNAENRICKGEKLEDFDMEERESLLRPEGLFSDEEKEVEECVKDASLNQELKRTGYFQTLFDMCFDCVCCIGGYGRCLPDRGCALTFQIMDCCLVWKEVLRVFILVCLFLAEVSTLGLVGVFNVMFCGCGADLSPYFTNDIVVFAFYMILPTLFYIFPVFFCCDIAVILPRCIRNNYFLCNNSFLLCDFCQGFKRMVRSCLKYRRYRKRKKRIRRESERRRSDIVEEEDEVAIPHHARDEDSSDISSRSNSSSSEEKEESGEGKF